MSPTNNKSIGCALTTEGGSNVSGMTGVISGARLGPHQANSEGTSGYQAGSRSTVTGNSPEAQGVTSTLNNHRVITWSMVPLIHTYCEPT